MEFSIPALILPYLLDNILIYFFLEFNPTSTITPYIHYNSITLYQRKFTKKN